MSRATLRACPRTPIRRAGAIRVDTASFAISAGMLVITGCGRLADLGEPVTPVVTVRGELRGGVPIGSTNPRAGILWAASPVFIPYCHEHGPSPTRPRADSPVAEAGCRDPFELLPRRLGPSVPLAPGQTTFEIPFDQLPPPDVMVGPLESRTAYGAVIVFDDRDGDEDLGLRRGCDFPSGSDRGPGGQQSPLTDPDSRLEPVIATSFFDLTEVQHRLAYVEGQLDRDSNFYPHPGCTELPGPGFSHFVVPGLLGESSDCAVEPPETPFVLELRPEQRLTNLSCRESTRQSFSRPARSVIGDLIFECTEDGSLALANPSCECPDVRVLSLTGCFDEVECTSPDWDLTADPPEEWPCPVPPRRP
ncbi:MAG: hypothetical protein HYV07_28950 [Deltaproteobacteria bacterium]|nr:hypothetical protein [Deltaproteobacteria bacterium]